MNDTYHLPQPEQYAREVLANSQRVLGDAVELVAGDRNVDPRSVFPAPTEVRAEGEVLNLTSDQTDQLRTLAAELGVGRESDQTLSELGLAGSNVIIEGGQPHKIRAELDMVLADDAARPAGIIVAASAERKVSSDAERQSAERLGVASEEPYSEYDVAEWLVRQHPGFVPLERPSTLPYGYDVTRPTEVMQEATGQLVAIGSIGETPVTLLRIDREYYVDEASGKRKYRQPGTAEVMQLVAGVSRGTAEPVAFVTSATYLPSRNVDATRAALKTDRVMGVASYGTARLAAVKGEAMPSPVALNQLPGEFHKLAGDVARLAAELGE